jgi:hypothetical protein
LTHYLSLNPKWVRFLRQTVAQLKATLKKI